MSSENGILAGRQARNTNGAKHDTTGHKKRFIFVIMLVIVLFAGSFIWKAWVSSSAPREDRYQAVFLDNGQVFFGKLKNIHGPYLKLENAYYSKSPELPENATAEQKAAVASNVSLIQVGDEVYGPEGVLSIRAEQVLFWQNLQSDSKVSKAIESADD